MTIDSEKKEAIRRGKNRGRRKESVLSIGSERRPHVREEGCQ